MFTIWRSIVIDKPESFPPFLSFITLVKICGYVVTYLFVQHQCCHLGCRLRPAMRIFLASRQRARGGTVSSCSVVVRVSGETQRSDGRVCASPRSRVWFCHPVDCSPPGSSVRGILQARTLEWVAISHARGSSRPRNWTWVSCIAGGLLPDQTMREGLHRLTYI